MRFKFFSTLIILAGFAAASASAQENTSRYTSVAAKNCKQFERTVESGSELASTVECKGLLGFVVTVGDADLRTFVSVGKNRRDAQKQPASEKTFSPFNSVNDNLEWRIDAKTKQPFATIQRWLIADNENPAADGRPNTVGLLVVTRLPPGPVCHVAYIDVRANENPNVLAQKTADELAAKFDCVKDQVQIVGNKGRAAALAATE